MAFTDGDFEYTLVSSIEKTCRVTKYNGTNPNVSIPATAYGTVGGSYGAYTVTEVSLYGNKVIQNVSLPSTIKAIKSFCECTNLNSITLNEGLESISDWSFQYTALTSIIIPKSVSYIGMGILSDCKSLETIVVESGNPYYDSRENCNSIIETSPNKLIAGSKNTTIPNSVKIIGEYTMSVLQGTYCNVPEGVTTIEEGAFIDCKVSSIMLPHSLKTIGRYAFSRCKNLLTITLQENVSSIASDAFMDSKNLASIYCMSSIPPAISSDSFSYWTGTIYVHTKDYKKYTETDIWRTLNVNSIPGEEIKVELMDSDKNYSRTENIELETITYTRTFSNSNWQSFYVPFAMNFDDWSDDFEVAEINNFHEYDDDEDGTVDRTTLEIIKKTSGNIDANTPYLIRAKETGEKTITLTDATLYKTEEKSVDCSSVKTKYTFTGTYNGVSGEDMLSNGYYALAGGALKQAASSSASLGAFRWYLKAEPRGGSSAKPRVNEINIRISDDDDATGIANADVKVSEAEYFTLSGAKVASMKAPGVYVVKNSDGTTKKVIKK